VPDSHRNGALRQLKAPSAVEQRVVNEAGLSAAEVGALYERYGFFLRRRCRMILRDEALADDALQESFLKIMRGGAEVRNVEHRLRWLYRVVDRCCFDHLRKRKNAPANVEAPDPIGPHPAIEIELRDAILARLGDLDDEEKQIAMLAFVDGIPQGEIAVELGWSRVTINKKIQAIRARANRILTEPIEGMPVP